MAQAAHDAEGHLEERPVHNAGAGQGRPPAESKGRNIREKLQKKKKKVGRGVWEGGRAHSARLACGEFINCGWTPIKMLL